MRSLYAKVLTAGLIVLAASPAFAQPRPGGPGGPGGPGMMQAPGAAMLLANEKVQEELKLTDDQKTAAQKAGATIREKYQEQFTSARGDREKMTELFKSMNADVEKALADILKPEQTKRLKQIEVQAAGPNAFTRDDVQTALKLTDAQQKDAKDATDDLQKDIRDLRTAAQGDPDKAAGVFKKIQDLRTETVEQIVKGLSADQKKAWQELTGDKFEVVLGPGGFGPVGGGAFGPGGPGAGPGGPGGPGGRGGLTALLRNEKVQTELKLSDDEKTAAQKAADDIGEKYRDQLTAARGDREKATEIRKAENADLLKALSATLKPEQTKRLKQIEVQAAGLSAFSMDDVQETLKLTDAQKKSIEDARSDVEKSMQTAFQDARGDQEKMADAFKKVQTLRTEALDKVVGGLTDDQKKAWKDLTGDKFEVDLGPGGFPGGPRRPGGPGRPNPNQ